MWSGIGAKLPTEALDRAKLKNLALAFSSSISTMSSAAQPNALEFDCKLILSLKRVISVECSNSLNLSSNPQLAHPHPHSPTRTRSAPTSSNASHVLTVSAHPIALFGMPYPLWGPCFSSRAFALTTPLHPFLLSQAYLPSSNYVSKPLARLALLSRARRGSLMCARWSR